MIRVSGTREESRTTTITTEAASYFNIRNWTFDILRFSYSSPYHLLPITYYLLDTTVVLPLHGASEDEYETY